MRISVFPTIIHRFGMCADVQGQGGNIAVGGRRGRLYYKVGQKQLHATMIHDEKIQSSQGFRTLFYAFSATTESSSGVTPKSAYIRKLLATSIPRCSYCIIYFSPWRLVVFSRLTLIIVILIPRCSSEHSGYQTQRLILRCVL